MATVAEFFRARAHDDHPGLYHGDEHWTYREFIALCNQRAAWLLAHRRPGPFHVGIMLDNVPEFAFWIGACAMAGATMVGINTTRRGADMERDINHTDCQVVITQDVWVGELDGLQLDCGHDRVLNTDTQAYRAQLAPFAGAGLPDVQVTPQDIFMLIFTSGSSGAPKACICSHGRIAALTQQIAQHCGQGPDTVSYVTMPWFHAGAINSGWLPAVSAGSATVIRKFTVSGFLADIRRYGVTHFSYVGKPLAYLLTAPEQPDDADNPLRIVLGNEGAINDVERFGKRFGCTVIDGYGSTEGGISISRRPGMPRGCLGLPNQEGVAVYNAQTAQECPRARLDADGRLLNPNEAIGELVNLQGAAGFEGYWKNPEAGHKRVRGGIYWSGDLAYRDEQGYFWFAGRDDEWLRVDGENIASAQIEEVLFRHPDVVLAGVYAVPDPAVGDRVMAALQLREGATFDAAGFEAFLHSQSDFGTKWMPSFVRVTPNMPVTATAKVLRRQLRLERWRTADPVWFKPERHAPFRPFGTEDVTAFEASFAPGALQRL